MALSDDLTAAWELNEASGDALDSHANGLDLPAGGSGEPGSATGLIYGTVRDFSGNKVFTDADNAFFSLGDVAATFEAWVNLDAVPSQGYVFAKDTTSGVNREYLLQVTSDRFRFTIWDTAGNLVQLTANTFGNVTTGTWYQVFVWHDPTANEIGISVNGTVDTASHSGGIRDAAAQFSIGGSSTGARPVDGRIGPIRFWKRVLTSDERTELYNSGSGRTYEYITDTGADTFTATAALTVGGATLSASGTFAPPDVTFGGEAALTVGGATLAGSAEFDPPVYDGTAALDVGAATLAGSATFDAPVYTGTAALNAGAATLAGSATFDPPVYTGAAALDVGPAEFAGSAAFADAIFSGSAALAVGGAALSGSAAFDVPVYTGTADLDVGAATLAGSAEFDPPATFTGSADLTVGAATLTGSAEFDPPLFTAAASLTVGAPTFSGIAQFADTVNIGVAILTVGGVLFSASGTVEQEVTPGVAAGGWLAPAGLRGWLGPGGLRGWKGPEMQDLSSGIVTKTPGDRVWLWFELADVPELAPGLGNTITAAAFTIDPTGEVTIEGANPAPEDFDSPTRPAAWYSGGTNGSDYRVTINATLSDTTQVERHGTLRVRQMEPQ